MITLSNLFKSSKQKQGSQTRKPPGRLLQTKQKAAVTKKVQKKLICEKLTVFNCLLECFFDWNSFFEQTTTRTDKSFDLKLNKQTNTFSFYPTINVQGHRLVAVTSVEANNFFLI